MPSNDCIFFVTDMPKIKGMDEATINSLKFIETSYSYLEGDLYESQKKNPNVRKADPELKRVGLKQKELLEAFASLVVKAHENEQPVAHECVMAESKEWTANDDISERFA